MSDRILDMPQDQQDRAAELDVLDAFDPDDDLSEALQDTPEERAVLNPPKKNVPSPLSNPTLEAIAQQIAGRLGKAIPATPAERAKARRERLDAQVGALLASADRVMGVKVRAGSRTVAPEGVEHVGTWANYVFSSPTVQALYQMSTMGRAGAKAILMENGKVALLDADGDVEKVEAPVMVHPIVASSTASTAVPVAAGKSGKPGKSGKSGSEKSEKSGSTAYAPADPKSEPRGLLDVFDPRHNMREMAKEMLLLEDHIAQPAKYCPDCIRKHLLRTEALAEEAVQLDVDGVHQDYLLPMPGQIRNLQRAFLDNEAVSDRAASLKGRLALQQQVRSMRKALSKRSFSALAFKPSAPVDPALGPEGAPVQPRPGDPGTVSGSPARTPVMFALDRGASNGSPSGAQGGQGGHLGGAPRSKVVWNGHRTGMESEKGAKNARLGADASPLDPLPSTVVAALRRRISVGDLQAHPIPVLYRTRVTTGPASGTTTISEGLVTNARSEGELVVQTLEVPPRTVVVPIGDVVLDFSGDDAFTAIPWPAVLPVTRDLSGRGARGADSAAQASRAEDFSIDPQDHPERWLMIRVIASVLWPVVDAFALRMAQGQRDPAANPAAADSSAEKSAAEKSALGAVPEMSLRDAARRAILQRILVAAVVNAVYESGLDPNVEADGGHDVGLFQLRDDGAGVGMSKAARRDPFLNTGRVGQRFLEMKKFFEPLGAAEAVTPGSTAPSAWTEAFTRYVEAPAPIPGKPGLIEKIRGDTTAAAFTRRSLEVAHAPAEVALVPNDGVDRFRPALWVLGGIGTVAAAVGLKTVWDAHQQAKGMYRFSRPT